MIKINREFLKTFVESLNVINISSTYMFPREGCEKNPGAFELEIQEVIIDEGVLSDLTKSIKVLLCYKERDKKIYVYTKDFRIRMDQWEQEADDSFFSTMLL